LVLNVSRYCSGLIPGLEGLVRPFKLLKMRPLCCLEISETTYLVIQRLIREEQIPYSHNYRKVNGVLIVAIGCSVKEKCG